jgi:hypothetical protein
MVPHPPWNLFALLAVAGAVVRSANAVTFPGRGLHHTQGQLPRPPPAVSANHGAVREVVVAPHPGTPGTGNPVDSTSGTRAAERYFLVGAANYKTSNTTAVHVFLVTPQQGAKVSDTMQTNPQSISSRSSQNRLCQCVSSDLCLRRAPPDKCCCMAASQWHPLAPRHLLEWHWSAW